MVMQALSDETQNLALSARLTAANEALMVGEAALAFYADDENWNREGRCDPNSGNFIGQMHARAALATIRAALEGKR
jgi:hypothetical protein